MNKFITLTKMDGNEIVINVAHITMMELGKADGLSCTRVSVNDHDKWFNVKETMGEIKYLMK